MYVGIPPTWRDDDDDSVSGPYSLPALIFELGCFALVFFLIFLLVLSIL